MSSPRKSTLMAALRRIALLFATLIAFAAVAFSVARFANAAMDVDTLTVTAPTTSAPAYSKADGGTAISIEGYGFLSTLTNTADKLVSSGDSRLALKDGNIYAWGENMNGQLGISDRRNADLPVRVSSGVYQLDGAWKNVDMRDSTACGVNGVRDAAAVYCWGNANGSPVPITLAALNAAYTIKDDALIAVSGSDVCVTAEDATGHLLACASISSSSGDVFEKRVATDIIGFTAISAQGSNICAITTEGITRKLYCNDGSDDELHLETLPPAVNTGKPKDIVLGSKHSCAVITNASNSDTLYCWGASSVGTFGYTPIVNTVDTLADALPTNFTSVQLETNNVGYKPQGNLNISSLDLSDDNTCVVLNVQVYTASTWSAVAPRALCWGSDAYSQFGDAYASATRYSPTIDVQQPYSPLPQLMSPNTARQVSVGGSSACYVTLTDGKVLCAGYDEKGQLGVGGGTFYAQDFSCQTINQNGTPGDTSDDYCSQFQVGSSSGDVPGSNVPVEVSPRFATLPEVKVDGEPCTVQKVSATLIQCGAPDLGATGLYDLEVGAEVVVDGVEYVDDLSAFTYPDATSDIEATFGVEYSLQADASPGATNFYVEGDLPSGLALTAAGELKGTPEDAPGDYDFKICAFSVLGEVFCSDDLLLTLLPGPTITTTETDYTVNLGEQNYFSFEGTGYENLRWSIINDVSGLPADTADLMAQANDNYNYLLGEFYVIRQYWMLDFINACPERGVALVPSEPVGGAADDTAFDDILLDTDACTLAFMGANTAPVEPTLVPPNYWQEHQISYGLPEGLSLSSATGVISGEPSLDAAGSTFSVRLQLVAGTCVDTVCADNSTPALGWPTLNVTFEVTDAPRITTDELLEAQEGTPYSMRVEATNPYRRVISISIAGNPLPTGLSFNGSKIEGTPSVSGVFELSLMAGSENETGTFIWGEPKDFSLKIAGSSITILDDLAELVPGEDYTAQIHASSNTHPVPTHYQVKDSLEPIIDGLQELEYGLGLYLNVNTGKITGSVPSTTRENIAFTVEASNGFGTTEQDLNIPVNHLITFLDSELPEAVNGEYYQATFRVAGDMSALQNIFASVTTWVIQCDPPTKTCTAIYIDDLSGDPKEVDFAQTPTLTLPIIARFNNDPSLQTNKNYTITVKESLAILAKPKYFIASRAYGDLSSLVEIRTLGAVSASIAPDVSNCVSGVFPNWLAVDQPTSSGREQLGVYAKDNAYIGEYCFRLSVEDAGGAVDSMLIRIDVVDRPEKVNESTYLTLGESLTQDNNQTYHLPGVSWDYNDTFTAYGDSGTCAVDLSTSQEVSISGTNSETMSISVNTTEVTCDDMSTLSGVYMFFLSGYVIDLATGLPNDFTINIYILPTIDENDLVANYNGSDTYEFLLGVDLDQTVQAGDPWRPEITPADPDKFSRFSSVNFAIAQMDDAQCAWPDFFTAYSERSLAYLAGTPTTPEAAGCFKMMLRFGNQSVVKTFNYKVAGNPVLTLKEQSIATTLNADSGLIYEATGEPISWTFMGGITPDVGVTACPANISPALENIMDKTNCYKYVADGVPYYNYGPIVFDNSEQESGSACHMDTQCAMIGLLLSPLVEGEFKLKVKALRTADTQYFTEDYATFYVQEAAEIDRACAWASPALAIGEKCDYPSVNARTLPLTNVNDSFEQPLWVTGTGVVTYVSGCKDTTGASIPGDYYDVHDPDLPYDHPEIDLENYVSKCLGLYVDGQTLKGILDTTGYAAGNFQIKITAKNAYTGASGVSRWFTLPVKSAPVFLNNGIVSARVDEMLSQPIQITGTLPISLMTQTPYVSFPYGVVVCGMDADIAGTVEDPDDVDYYMPKHTFDGEQYVYCNGSPQTVSNLYTIDTASGGTFPACTNAAGAKYCATEMGNEVYVKCGIADAPACQTYAFYGIPSIFGSYNISLTATNELGSVTSSPPYEVTVDEQPRFVSSAIYDRGNLGVPYSWNVEVTGGGGASAAQVVATSASEVAAAASASGTTYSCDSHYTLPSGLSLTWVNETSAVVSGTPTGVDGYYCFKVNVTTDFAVISQIGQILILKEPSVQLNTLPNGRVGVVYGGVSPGADKTMYYPCYEGSIGQCAKVNFNIDATIAVPWVLENETALGGEVPPGLYFDGQSSLMGTPTTAGTYTIHLLGNSTVGTVRKDFTMVVESKPEITDGDYFADANVGAAYASDEIPYTVYPPGYADSVSINAAAGTAGCEPIESLVGVNVANLCYSGLPPGLAVSDQDGDSFKISGTPSAQGIYKFRITPSSSFKPDRCSNTGFAVQYMTTCTELGSKGSFTGLLRVDGPAELGADFELPDAVTGREYREEIEAYSTTTVSYEYLTGEQAQCQALNSTAGYFTNTVPGLTLGSDGVVSGIPTSVGQYHICTRVSNTHSPSEYAYSDVSILVHGVPEFASTAINHLPSAVVAEHFENTIQVASSVPIDEENVIITGTSNIGGIFPLSEDNIALSREVNQQVLDLPDITARTCQAPYPVKVTGVTARSEQFGYDVSLDTIPDARTKTDQYICFALVVFNSVGFNVKVFYFETKGRPAFTTDATLAPWSKNVEGYSDAVQAKEVRQYAGQDVNGNWVLGTDEQGVPKTELPPDSANPPAETITYTSPDLQTQLGAGMSIDPATGVISGRPTPSGTGAISFSVEATNTSGLSKTKQFTIEILDAPILDLPSHNWKIASGKYQIAYSYQFTVLEDPSPGSVSMSIAPGSIPQGLEFDEDTFTLAGTPLEVANNPCAQLSVTVTKNGASRTQPVTLCIDDSPPVLLDQDGVRLRQQQSLPGAALNLSYEYTLQAEGNTNGADGEPDGMRFVLASGNLPPGISLEETDDVNKVKLVGSGNTVGSYYFEIAVYNSLCNPDAQHTAQTAGGSDLQAYSRMCIDSKRNLLLTVGGIPTPSQHEYPTAYLGQGNNGLRLYNDSPEFSGVQPMQFELGLLEDDIFTPGSRAATYDDLCTDAESWQGNLLNLVVPTDEARAQGLVLPPCYAFNTNDGKLIGSSLQDLIQNKPAGTLDALDWLEGSFAGDNLYPFAIRISNISGVHSAEYSLEVAGEPKIVSEELDYAIYGMPFSDYITSYGLNPLKYQIMQGDLQQYNMRYDCESGEIYSDSVQFGTNHSEQVEFIVVARNDAGCNAALPEGVLSLSGPTRVQDVPGQVRPMDTPISLFAGYDVKKVHINIYELPKADYVLPNAMQGVHYAKAFKVTGTRPIEFFPNTSDECLALGAQCVDLQTASSLIPSGMYFTRDGVLQGVPQRPGTYRFVLASKNIAGYGEQVAQITVLPNPEYSTSAGDSDLFSAFPREGEYTDYDLYKFDASHDAMFDSLLGRYGHDLSKYTKWKSRSDTLGATRDVAPRFMLLPVAVSLLLVVLLLLTLFACVYLFNHKQKKILKKIPEGGDNRTV